MLRPFLATILACATTLVAEDQPTAGPEPSPTQICLSHDGSRAYILNQGNGTVAVLDVAARKVLDSFAVGRHPSDAVLSPDGSQLIVTCTHDQSVAVVDLEKRSVTRRIKTGFEPIGASLSVDGSRLAVANSLTDKVTIHNAADGDLLHTIGTGRLPRFLAETPDGSRMVVANAHSRDLTIIDPVGGHVVETRTLGRAAQMRQIAVTPDGRWAIIATLVGHDEMITMQMERGWINSNGFIVLDLQQPGHYVTLLLDRVLQGATNPWAVEISPDAGTLWVSLAGIHQVAIIDLPGTLELVRATSPDQVQRLSQETELLEQKGLARRVSTGGVGPRGLAYCAPRNELLVANYFSNSISILDGSSGEFKASVALGPAEPTSLWRRGEMHFNDGRICFQNWYSCASCHQEDATMDSLNWDLINDGIGNPKNAKSMHNGILTPPAMWSGVRADQNVGTMAGQRFLGFLPDEQVQKGLIEYIGKPRRAPNPWREADPEAIRRGETAFYRARCDACHYGDAFSDQRKHDIGLRGLTMDVDFRSRFDTPSLLECYRTAPYLHDGRAATLREIFTHHNPDNAHGLTRGMSEKEIDDLVTYLRTL